MAPHALITQCKIDHDDVDDNDDPGAADMEPGDKEDVKKKLPVEAPATNSSSAVVTKSSVQSDQAPATNSSAPAVT